MSPQSLACYYCHRRYIDAAHRDAHAERCAQRPPWTAIPSDTGLDALIVAVCAQAVADYYAERCAESEYPPALFLAAAGLLAQVNARRPRARIKKRAS